MTLATRSDALGFATNNGLPAHILLVHAVVVFVPLAAVALIAALRQSVARRLGGWLPGVSAIAFVAVLAAMNAGGWLENHVQDTALVRAHTAIAGQLWPFSLLVLVLSVAVWWVNGRESAVDAAPPTEVRARSLSTVAGGTVTSVVVGVVVVVVAIGSVVQVIRIGDSGSKASWHDHFSRAVVQNH